MICKNCGGQMGDFDTFCPNCGASNTINTANAQYSQSSYAQTSTEPIKTTGLLVWSIIETVCINLITGIIAIILWATKLKPAANRGDVVEAQNAKKTIKVFLWVGLILWIVGIMLIIGLQILATHNLSVLQQRTVTTANNITAAQIGKAARIWYDEAIMESKEYKVEDAENGFVKIDEMEDFDDYCSSSYVPMYTVDGELEEGAYYVTIINEDEPGNEKIVVAIGPENLYSVSRDDDKFYETFSEDLDEVGFVSETYDENGSGIAYVEP